MSAPDPGTPTTFPDFHGLIFLLHQSNPSCFDANQRAMYYREILRSTAALAQHSIDLKKV
jgi:hypothetical protein